MKGLVWGHTFGIAIDKLHQIEENYNYIGIQSVKRRETRSDYSIEFDNGDYWRAVNAVDSKRACKANISYVDAQIDPDFVETIIRPSTHLPPYNAIRYFYPPRDCWLGEDE